MPPYLTELQLIENIKSLEIELSPLFFSALDQAKKSHANQKRDDGKSYLEEHIFPMVLELAVNLEDCERSENLLIAALLHDVLEDDENMTEKLFIDQFGIDIFKIVKPITKVYQENNGRTEAEKLEINKKIIKKLKDAPKESRLIKLVDRVNNLECSIACGRDANAEKYDRYIRETREIFLPFAKEEYDYYHNKILNILNASKSNY